MKSSRCLHRYPRPSSIERIRELGVERKKSKHFCQVVTLPRTVHPAGCRAETSTGRDIDEKRGVAHEDSGSGSNPGPKAGGDARLIKNQGPIPSPESAERSPGYQPGLPKYRVCVPTGSNQTCAGSSPAFRLLQSEDQIEDPLSVSTSGECPKFSDQANRAGGRSWKPGKKQTAAIP